jgi:DNA-binding MarR family transcriptional regulator
MECDEHAPQNAPPVAETGCWLLLYPRLAAICRMAQRRTSLSMTEIAVLFALHDAGTTEVRTLRRSLAADAGYLSRILAGFAREGMVALTGSPHDGRQQRVNLTPLGAERCAAVGMVVAETAREVLTPRQTPHPDDPLLS